MAKVFSKGGWGIFVIPLLVILAIVVYFNFPEKNNSNRIFNSEQSAEFIIQIKNLPASSDNHYELWSKDPSGGEQIVGSFRVLEGGTLVSMAGDPLFSMTSNYVPITGSELLVTLEKGKEQTIKRSGRVILKGTLNVTEAELGFPFLITKESQQATVTKSSGIQFSGLSLPDLNDGWIYGGWVITASDKKLPTGTFEANNKTPGKDFPELNLVDGKTRVTVDIQPSFDNDNESVIKTPFISLLSARIPYKQANNKAFSLERISKDDFPSGKISIEPKEN